MREERRSARLERARAHLDYHFNSTPHRALMRLHRGAEFGVVVDVEARGIGQAQRRRGAGIRAVLAFADALERDALGAEADGDVGEILHDIVDELAVGRQVENLPVEDPVMADLRADQQPRALHGGARRHHGIEAADLLQRTGPGADIFERGLGHDAALVPGPVIADLAQHAVEPRVVSGGRKAKAGVAARIDVAETVHHRAGPGPRPAVDGGGEAELGQVDRRRLQRQRNVDRGAALVDREADIDARRHPRADPGHAAPGLAGVADEIADRAVLRGIAVAFEPGPVARRFRALGGAAAARIGPLQAVEAVARLVAQPLQEIAAEIGHRRARRHRRIDHRRRRDRASAKAWVSEWASASAIAPARRT